MTCATPEDDRQDEDGQALSERPVDRADLNLLTQQLSELARSLEAEDDTDTMLDNLVAAAVAQIPGVDEGSLSVVLDRQKVLSKSPPPASCPNALTPSRHRREKGPCLDAVSQEEMVVVPDMRTEKRWPKCARRAADAGAAGMLSF